MSLYEIPLSAKNQKFKIRLNGTTYQFKFVFRKRWYLDLADPSNQPLINGLPLVHGINLLEQYQHVIRGALIMLNSHEDESQSLNDLGSKIKLYWSDPV